MEYKERLCPVCGSNQPNFVHLQVFTDSVSHQIARCALCKSYYNLPEINTNLVDYKNSEKYLQSSTFGSDSVLDRSNTLSQFNYLKNFLKEDSTILEIGFGPGSLMKVLYEKGHRRLAGVEPSTSARKSLLEKLNHSDLMLYSDLGEVRDKFDFIIASHVLEHVDSPRHFLEQISTKLSSEGVLYLEVPDASRYFDFKITPFHFFDQEHISHFTISNLSILLSNYFDILKMEQTEVLASSSSEYPVIRVLCRSKGYDEIERYLEWSRTGIKHELPANLNFEKPFFVYGWGSYAQAFSFRHSIPSLSGFMGVIDSFVSEPHSASLDLGKEKFTISIFGPMILNEFPNCSVLVLSALFSRDITLLLMRDFPSVGVFLPNSLGD
jgi:SAM-dependent methyltransferase